MIFSQKVRLLRKKKGFTQTTFAKEIGVSRQSVYKWEDGQAYPEVERLVKMKMVFACSIDDLLDDGMSVSDDGTLKPNSVVEYENAHKKVRKPRKDKGIKTGIPPMRKNGEPVVRRKKPVEEPIVPVAEPVVEPVAEPAAPARMPSFRTRPAPSFTHRDAAARARAAVSQRRFGANVSDDFGDDFDLTDDNDFSEGAVAAQQAPAAMPAYNRNQFAAPATAAPAPAEEPAPVEEPKKPKEKKRVASLMNTEADGTQAARAAEAAAAEAAAPAPVAEPAPAKKPAKKAAPVEEAPAPAAEAAPVAEEPKVEEKKKGGLFGFFRRK